MKKDKPKNIDEIDLLDILKILWSGKWIISSFVTVAFLLGIGFIFSKENAYESQIIFSLNITPPYDYKDNIKDDFQKMFYSSNVFEEWKNNSTKISFAHEDFYPSKTIDGYIFSKNEDELLAKLNINNSEGGFVIINSKEQSISNSFFEYAQYINRQLTSEYLTIAKEEVEKIKSYVVEKSYILNKDILDLIIRFDRFINSINKGSTLFFINQPSLPKKVSSKAMEILTISIASGGMIGVIFFLFLYTYRKYYHHLTKSLNDKS